MRRTWPWTLAFLLLIQPPGLSAPAPGPAVDRDTIVVGTAALEPVTLNPLFEPGPVTAFHEIIPVVFTVDVQRDAQWRPVPQGVEALPTFADGTWQVQGDRMILLWKLRPRHWHDGVPVTCADYVFSHRVGTDRRVRIAAESRVQMDRIASVSCPRGPSGRDVRVAWKVRDAYANLTVIGQLARLPRHLVEPFYRADPGRLNVAPYGADARMAIGDGAYRVVEWRTGVSMTLERVPDHGIFGAPRTKRLIWRFFQDFGLFPALLDGAVDVTLGNTSLAFDRAVELDRRRGSGYRVFFVPGLTWEHIDFNLDNPWLKDVRVRQAIAHAVNRTQIIQQTFFGKARLAHSYLPPRHPGHAGDVVTYRYDPSRARTLLADAGLRPGTDGVLRDSAGRRVELELSTRSGVQIREQTQQIIREQLGLVGIDVVIRNFPLREFFSERLGKRRFEAMILYAWVFSPTSDCDLVYTSDGIPTASNTWLGSNYPGYRSAEMDRICKAIPRELDPVRRRDLLQESARLFARDLPALPLYFRIDVAAAKAGLRNIAPRGLGVFETWNTQEWHWE